MYKTLLLFTALFYLNSCSTNSHLQETGIASFYSSKFNNRITANGEIFHQSKKTAAHKELPFGSEVKVTNLDNGKSVTVTINDRGPFIKGRIIDLSSSSFQEIGQLRDGLLKVKIEVLN